jgi:deoxyribonuclease-4
MRFGYHMGLGGGFKKQIPLAKETGAETVQIFAGNPTAWKPSKTDEVEIAKSHQLAADYGIDPIVFHTAYLINLATPKDEFYEKSKFLLLDSLKRAAVYRSPYVVTHIGSHLGTGLEVGLKRITDALTELRHDWPEGVTLLLENTAGSGGSIGDNFSEIGAIMRHFDFPDWLGVCFDTCHAWSAGYELSSEAGWEETLAEFEREIGLSRLKCFHANDTDAERGSHIDRHQHIGQGKIGLEGFRVFVNHPSLQGRPVILETPDDIPDAYRTNLDTLRSLRQ